MDYDITNIPSAYDAGRSYAPATLQFWLKTISSAIGPLRITDILDLGCGTGRYSAALANHFGACVVGVDPSEKMLTEARRKRAEGVRYLKGPAEAIPLGDDAVDMIFLSMVFHHVKNPRLAALECRRVLRQGGVLCIREATSDRNEWYPHMRFFPSAKSLIVRDLRSLAFIEATFSEACFERVGHQVVNSEVAANWLLFAEKISHRADSILAQISDEDFQRGLVSLRDHAQKAHEPVTEPIDLLVFRREATDFEPPYGAPRLT